jgi:hypothetical protein
LIHDYEALIRPVAGGRASAFTGANIRYPGEVRCTKSHGACAAQDKRLKQHEHRGVHRVDRQPSLAARPVPARGQSGDGDFYQLSVVECGCALRQEMAEQQRAGFSRSG